MREDAYQSAVDYIHSLGECEWKLGLERFVAFCQRLGNPQKRLKIVHVAGTNGKGSTTAMIAAVLSEAGYRTGEYFSPFVYDIRERFRLNGEMMPRETLVELVGRMRPHAESLAETVYGHPTEFEMKTALALLWFAQEQADFAVLEVGLGGRLDATNIVNPLVSVITNVSLDHTDRLGATIAEIAAEKAGIIKERVPVVTAAWEADAIRVIRATAAERNAEVWEVSRCNDSLQDFKVDCDGKANPSIRTYSNMCDCSQTGRQLLNYRGVRRSLSSVEVGMRGHFQLINAATALAAIEVLESQGLEVTEQMMREGLKRASLPGRLELIRSQPCVVLDGAHNAMAANMLAHEIRCHFDYDHLILVIGMVTGHSFHDVVSILSPLATKVIATSPKSPRAVSAEVIASVAKRFCNEVDIVTPVAEALRNAVESASGRDLICVTGSFYTIGEVPRDIRSIVSGV